MSRRTKSRIRVVEREEDPEKRALGRLGDAEKLEGAG